MNPSETKSRQLYAIKQLGNCYPEIPTYLGKDGIDFLEGTTVHYSLFSLIESGLMNMEIPFKEILLLLRMNRDAIREDGLGAFLVEEMRRRASHGDGEVRWGHKSILARDKYLDELVRRQILERKFRQREQIESFKEQEIYRLEVEKLNQGKAIVINSVDTAVKENISKEITSLSEVQLTVELYV